MKKELEYMLLCEALNEAEKKSVWSLLTNSEGMLVFDGEIDGEKVQMPADLMLEMAKNKNNAYRHEQEL